VSGRIWTEKGAGRGWYGRGGVEMCGNGMLGEEVRIWDTKGKEGRSGMIATWERRDGGGGRKGGGTERWWVHFSAMQVG